MNDTNDSGSGNNGGRWFGQFAQLNQRLFEDSLSKAGSNNEAGVSVWFDLLESMRKFGDSAQAQPGNVINQQVGLWRDQMQVWQNTLLRMSGKETEPLVQPDKGDHRFIDSEWSSNPLFDYLKQSYLLTSRGLLNTITSAEGIDDKTRHRLLFFTRQYINAMAPTNFLMTNPEVLRLTQESRGQNLLKGMEQLAEDMEKSADTLNIRMTDLSAFRVGDNIATTPGKVVFRNHLFELIQYAPATPTVHRRPLLMVPPWINKFYVMDLREDNSFMRWAVHEGHTVFVMSWVNPGPAYRNVRIDDYMHDGLLTALDAVERATGEHGANVVGYCIGGILLAITQAWLAAKGEADRITSGSYLATLLDFTDPGDIGVFVDEAIVQGIEHELDRTGVFDGRMMAVAFSLLRENDLYWNYYVQNYLKGERPIPFDLLYWNSDSTNLPAATHRFILRELYLGNKLRVPGGITVGGVPIDLGKIKTPVYMLATLQDHIAKWRGCYAGVHLHGGPVTFVLGESGHIAGVASPPGGKYGYYQNDHFDDGPDAWFEGAQRQAQSWWLHWKGWVAPFLGEEVPAREPGGGRLPVLCDAPGEYVHVKVLDALQAGR